MPFSQTFPRSGSMRTGRLFPRPAWVPPIAVSVGSVLPTPRASRGASSTETVALLPTPGKADGDGGHLSSEGHQSTLPGVTRDLALLPSPRTSDTNGAGHHGDGGMDLRTAVTEIALLPTPAVNDMGMAYTPEEWDAWTEKMKAKHGNGNGHGKSLNVEAQRLLPTPTRRDHKDSEICREPHRPDDVDTLARALTDVPAALLPAPSVADSTGGHERRGGERGEELLLKGVVRAAADGTLLPTPRATDGTKGGPNQRGSSGDLMLPSAVASMSIACSYCGELREVAGCDNCDAGPLPLLPTPTAVDYKSSGGGYNGQTNVTLTDATVRQTARWGEYEPAIRRWEAITRPAPEPTKPNSKGSPKLSDEFDEWLMGLPAGWITDVPGITWNEVLKACGNGVLPQQCVAALHYLRHLSAL